MKVILILFSVFNLCLAEAVEQKTAPEILLAKTYENNINLKNYWVSEKLDGVRAYWNGESLRSRKGNVFMAPDWFTSVLPKQALDGELWLGRGKFAELSGRVRRREPNGADWNQIRYMVFDLPKSPLQFNERLLQLSVLVTKINAKHVQLIKQFKVKNNDELEQKLSELTSKGAEGLMLHDKNSYYKNGRHSDLLKLKKYQDAEAIVIKHIPGKGKYKNMMGAMLVETIDKKRFKIGTGFSDKQRVNPPNVGSVITYKYYGLTKNGIPRFASYMRVRGAH